MDNVTTSAQESQHIEKEHSRTKLPISTIVVLVITALVTGLQFVYPAVLEALRRNPQALARGEWWRMFTPLLVHDGGVWHFAYVALGIVLVGFSVERTFGSLRWLILYLSAGITGEIVGYAWDPHGAGASVAMCGLVGGFLVWQFWHNRSERLMVSLYVVGLIGALTGFAIGGLILNIILCVVPTSALFWLPNLKVSTRVITGYIGIFGLLGAVILTILHDIHGPTILAGVCLAGLLLWLDTSLRHNSEQA